jgi:hypothetical protein
LLVAEQGRLSGDTGWKSTRMPLQYAAKINAARSGMATAGAATGRNKIAYEMHASEKQTR